MSQQETKKHGYDGSRLKDSIAKLVAPLDAKANELKLAKTLGQEKVTRVESRPLISVKPVVVPTRTQSRIGFAKLTITITEEMALQLLNYAGHSSKKQSTIDVFHAKNKPSFVENAAPVYPLSELYSSHSSM